MGSTVSAQTAIDGSSAGQWRKSERLWNRNFLLLWQGQLVSSVGDVAYEIALGFWILLATGSSGLMGALMAASMACWGSSCRIQVSVGGGLQSV